MQYTYPIMFKFESVQSASIVYCSSQEPQFDGKKIGCATPNNSFARLEGSDTLKNKKIEERNATAETTTYEDPTITLARAEGLYKISEDQKTKGNNAESHLFSSFSKKLKNLATEKQELLTKIKKATSKRKEDTIQLKDSLSHCETEIQKISQEAKIELKTILVKPMTGKK